MWFPMGAPRDPHLADGFGPGQQPTDYGQPLSLLLVEDDRADAVLVEELLVDAVAGVHVLWAQSMAQAERELAFARPDCVLLDLHLSDANGIDALDRIAKCDARVPIVVLTGLNDEHFGVSAVASGAQDYLVKGRVEPDVLRRALLYAIEREGKPSAGRIVDLRRRALLGRRAPLGYRFIADVLQRMKVDASKRTDLAALGTGIGARNLAPLAFEKVETGGRLRIIDWIRIWIRLPTVALTLDDHADFHAHRSTTSVGTLRAAHFPAPAAQNASTGMPSIHFRRRSFSG